MSNDPEAVTHSGSAISLENPFKAAAVETAEAERYEATLERGAALRALPFHAAGEANRQRQHLKASSNGGNDTTGPASAGGF